ncbi:TolC family protein [Pontibacter roseus]|uniref:TolC family protein n=1 Tax=Pontibacter roseus TaxID=336989 RepID=UPI00039C432B|nr:TolC family protein [Pontibacter roseus]
MNTKHLFVGLALLLMKPALAQQQPEAKELNLQQAVTYALEHNEDVQKASYDELSAQYVIKEAKSNGLPQVNAFGKVDAYPALPTQILPGEIIGKPGTTVPVQFGTKYNAQGGVQFSQLLFSKSYFVGLQAAKTTEDLFRLRKQMTEEDVIYNVGAAYFQILQTQEQFNTIEANLNRLTQLEKLLQLQYKNDLVKKVDVNRITVNRSNLETQKQTLTSALEQQVNVLKFFMGMPLEENITLANSAILLDTQEPQHIDVKQVAEQQTQYKLLRTQQELNDLQVKNIRAGYYPSLNLTGSYLYQAQRQELNFFDTNLPWFNTGVVGLQLNIPIFDGFKKNAQVQQAQIEAKKLEEDTKKLNKNTMVQLTNSINQLNNSTEAIKAQERNVTLAQEVYNTTNELYKEGISPLTDLLEAEVTLREANTNLNNEQLKYQLAQLGYLKAKGELKTLVK